MSDKFDSDLIDHLDGVRVTLDDGWFLIRASGTESVVRLTAEARSTDRAERLYDDVMAIVDRARTLAS